MRQAILYVDEPHLPWVVRTLESAMDDGTRPMPRGLTGDLRAWCTEARRAFANEFAVEEEFQGGAV